MRRTRNILVPFVLVVLLGVAAASGQADTTAGKLCLNRARSAPHCETILETNFGLYGIAGVFKQDATNGNLRMAGDWGLLRTIGPRSAVGGSVLMSLDAGGIIVGPALRYRRWLSEESSVEVAIGASTHHTEVRGTAAPTVVFGLVRWNPARGVSLSLRPERRRVDNRTCLNAPPYTCTPNSREGFALSAGLEIVGVPGMIGSLLGAALGLAVIAGSAP